MSSALERPIGVPGESGPADQVIVLRMSSNPDPKKVWTVFNRQRSVMQTNSH